MKTMKRTLTALLIGLLLATGKAEDLSAAEEKLARQEYPTDTLYKLWSEYRKDARSVLQFYAALPQKHIVELNKSNPKKATVTYFAKGSPATELIMQSGGPDLYGLRFKRIGSSAIYFCTQEIPSDAWFRYGVNEHRRARLEPHGGVEQTTIAQIDNGAVIGPDAPLSPYVHANSHTPKGALLEASLDSKQMGESRRISVYLPAGYDAHAAHKLVIQFDGQNYTSRAEQGAAWEAWVPMPTILDNLILQKKIVPTVVVFIHNQGRRSSDLISNKMADFVALEVVDWARRNYSIAQGAANVVVSGASRGGFAAANTAFRHSDIVGGVLSQSASLYYTLQAEENWPIYPEFEGKLILDYKHAAPLAVRFYLDVGLYDLGLGAVGTNRQFRDILQLKGYQVDYYQYKGGHSHLGWRHTLAKGLISLLSDDALKLALPEKPDTRAPSP